MRGYAVMFHHLNILTTASLSQSLLETCLQFPDSPLPVEDAPVSIAEKSSGIKYICLVLSIGL